MAAIVVIVGLIGAVVGLVVGLAGGFFGLIFGLFGGSLAILSHLVPAALIVLGVVWLVKGAKSSEAPVVCPGRGNVFPPQGPRTAR